LRDTEEKALALYKRIDQINNVLTEISDGG